MKRIVLTYFFFCLLFHIQFVNAQVFGKGDAIYRARNDHAGNLVRMTFYNNGRLGAVRNDQSLQYTGEWPIGSGKVQMGNTSPYVMSELRVPLSIDTVAHDTTYGYVTPAIWGEGWDPNIFPHDSAGRFQGFEPLPGFLSTLQKEKDPKHAVAMNHQPFTWPSIWPDKTADPINPGWPNHWNGYFGMDQQNADQESFYMMDDYQYNRKITVGGVSVKLPLPVLSEIKRGGLGLRVAIRGFQWSNPDAEDCIFWLYDINNFGQLNLDRTLFGINVGASSGGVLSGGGSDFNDDGARFYREKGLAVNFDTDNSGVNGYSPVPWVGFAFLESPGNPYDGIDNDGDGNDPKKPGGGTGKIITTDDFVQTYQVGDPVVLIDYSTPYYTRTLSTMPDSGIKIQSRQYIRTLRPNQPLLEIERNGIDDNLNGLIDENDGAMTQDSAQYYLYIRSTYNNQDYLAKNYFTGDGESNLLIDERRNDQIDNDGDWNFQYDDVGMDGKPGTNDEGEGDGQATPGRGELPGEPNIDKVDVDESDQIGLTSFKFYEYSKLEYSNEKQMWDFSNPGYFDNTTTTIADYDYVFSSGYFPLRSSTREAFSLALIYGIDEQDILRNKDKVQEIYNANYNFAIAPIKPKVSAVASDRQIILYWDDKAESSFDRYLHQYDFEGYKIYKSTDYTFADAGTITDGLGYDRYKKPIAIYDKIDSVFGFFPNDFRTGVKFNLGNEAGLAHTFVDRDVVNGQRYFYAVTAYDRGDLAKNIGPTETSIFVNVDASGNILFAENVVAVTPLAPSAGFSGAGFEIIPSLVGEGLTNGSVGVNIINPDSVKNGDEYEIQFLDQSMDGIDNNHNGLIETTDPAEWLPIITSGFILKNLSRSESDTIWIYSYGIESKKVDSLTVKDTIINIQNLYNDNDGNPRTFSRFLRGLEVSVYNPPPGVYNDAERGIINGIKWGNGLTIAQSYGTTFGPFSVLGYRTGITYPRQYKIVFHNSIVDTSQGIKLTIAATGTQVPIPRIPVNFKIFDMLTGDTVKFGFIDARKTPLLVANGFYSAQDRIVLYEKLPNDSVIITYQVFNNALEDSTFYKTNGRILGEGDTLYLYTDNPFNSQVRFRFKLKGESIDQTLAKQTLSNIKVVPNPYVVTSVWEQRNPYTTARDEQIQFIHLPQRCTIRIYSVDGSLVHTLEHQSTMRDGAETWDLKSRERMNVSYGVYIYHVDAPGIGEHIGKIFLIK